MARGGAAVRVYGDWDPAGINKAKQDLSNFDRQVSGFSGSISKSFLGVGAAIGAVFSVTTIVDFLKNTTQAALDDERSMVALAKAMENLGVAAENAAVEDFVLQLALASGVADDQLRPSLQRLIVVTGDVAKSQDALKVAMDVAAGTGRDLDSVSAALARGFSGQTTALQRLGVGLDAALLKSKDMDAITAALSEKFGGQAAAAADTYQGRLNRVSIAAGEAQEAIGYALLNAVDDLSESVGGTGGVVQNIIDLGDAIAGVITFTSNAVQPVTRLAAGLGLVDASGKSLIDTMVDLGAKFGWLIPGVGNIVNLLSTASLRGQAMAESQKQLRGTLSGTVGAAQAAGDAIGSELVPETYDAADAADKAAKSYLSLWESIWNTRRAAADLANTSGTVTSALAEGARTGGVQGYWQSLQVEYGKTSEKLRGVGSSSRSTAESLTELRDKFAETFSDTMRERITTLTDTLKQNLEDAQQKARDFASNMQGTILQGFGIGAAYESALNEEGKLNADAWVAGVDSIVAKWQWFGNVLQAVRGPGNDPARQALAEYLSKEGADKGAVMGQALIDNGLVQTMADKMQLVRDQAAVVANNMVPEYLTAGVSSAQATYDGFKAAAGKGGPVYEALMDLMDNLASSMKRSTTITVTTINRTINEVIGSFGYGGGRAVGGPVSANTAYTVGERGPELFIPNVSGTIIPNEDLSRSRGGNSYTINVNTGVGDPRQIGQQVIEYIKRFEAANGPVFQAA